MTETEAGAINKPNLIDDISVNLANSYTVCRYLSFDQIENIAIQVLSVMRRRGLITEQGLELIKREETK